jgi:hypothetical protein
MPTDAGPIYEVTLSITRERLEEFDAWLAHHVDEMLALPGFTAAEVFAMDSDEPTHVRRVCQYSLESDDHLAQYLDTHAPEMRQSGIDHFGDDMSAERRILHRSEITAVEIRAPEPCLNCGAALTGQYCGNCGQRARSRLISLWELVRDAFGDIFELDSRIWRTLWPLLFQPGKLTKDYLEGRRARFMPPFRTYLVLSVLFFLVLFFDPRSEFGLLFEPTTQSQEQAQTEEEKKAEASEIRKEIMDELAAEGIVVAPPGDDAEQDAEPPLGGLPDSGPDTELNAKPPLGGRPDSGPDTELNAKPPPDAQPDSGSDAEPVAEPDADDNAWKGARVTFGSDDESEEGDDDGCDFDDPDSLDVPEWMKRRLTPERVKAVCEKVQADNGKGIVEKVVDNTPAALFFLLPLMAFVLKLAYPLSKRYYVEHVLFVVHYHAFIFALLILIILFSRSAEWLQLPSTLVQIVLSAASFYVPVYLYKAMRRVYGQGHLITIPKFLFLLVAYISGLALIVTVTALLAAFSI